MDTLSGLDAAFLEMETPTSHLHVTGVLVLDPSTMPGGYRFDAMRRFMASRLEAVPSFRRRVADVPLVPGYTAWVDDADFDLDHHVRRAAVPAPGGPAELAEFVGELASRPLDRTKPLWQMWFAEGLDGGHVALVATLHHAMIDGVAGAELVAQLLDLEPRDADALDPPAPWEPRRTPSAPALVAGALAARARRRLDVARSTTALATTAARLIARRVRGSRGMAAPFTAPPTRFNTAISAHRRVAFTGVPLATVKAVKDAFGVTVNDVVLAVCAGALRRYLAATDELPDRPLVAAVPVSVRGRATGDGANQVSAMLVSLPTDTADPAERVHRVADAAGGAKDEHEALGPDTIGDVGGLAASPVLGAGARAYSQLHLAERVRQPVNLVVSNIPGPGVPLYLGGAKLRALYPLGPIYDGMGLNVTVFSYLDTVGFGFLACRDRVRDLDRLADAVTDALHELEKVAAAGPPRVHRTQAPDGANAHPH